MRNKKIGIVGGGQLGMLLLQAAIPFPCHVLVYDPNPNCSAAFFTQNFTQGSFDDKDSIVAFGKQCDVVIFEIEKTNVEALKELQSMGIRVLSSPETLEWIQDKSKQREALAAAGFPQPKYEKINADEIENYDGPFPIVQKFCTGGYDGYGVAIHKDKDALMSYGKKDSIFEEKVDLAMELSVLVARSESGETVTYDPIEMVFDPELNLLDYQIAPARIETDLVNKLETLSQEIAEKMNFIGVYAIEFFLTKSGELLVNEISPRVHNSGHHTVAANVASQYEQQIRIALELPLGSPEMLSPSVLANLIADQSTGATNYVGLENAYKIPNIQFTFYGKPEVRPGRKMGHAVILNPNVDDALAALTTLRNTLTITSHA